MTVQTLSMRYIWLMCLWSPLLFFINFLSLFFFMAGICWRNWEFYLIEFPVILVYKSCFSILCISCKLLVDCQWDLDYVQVLFFFFFCRNTSCSITWGSTWRLVVSLRVMFRSISVSADPSVRKFPPTCHLMPSAAIGDHHLESFVHRGCRIVVC